jgi:hypothetical protein
MQASDYIAIAKMITDLGLVVLLLVLHKNADGTTTPIVLLPLNEETKDLNAEIIRTILEAKLKATTPPATTPA